MENLEKLIYDLYKKNARQCTNEEIYNALLIYTKNQLFEKGYQDGKKKISSAKSIRRLISLLLPEKRAASISRIFFSLRIEARTSRIICTTNSSLAAPLLMPVSPS